MSLLTNVPAATVIADTGSGGFAHVNLVMPRESRVRRADREMELLKLGADPLDFLSSGYSGDEYRTK